MSAAISAGAFCRASVRRARCMPPLWVGRVRPVPVRPVLARALGPDEEYRAKAGDEAGGVRLKAPRVEPVSRPVAGRSAAATSELMDVTAGETAPILPVQRGTIAAPPARRQPLPQSERVDLSTVRSRMDQSHEQTERQRSAAAQAALAADGKVWCGPCDARVPAWFGRDCISTACPLRSKPA